MCKECNEFQGFHEGEALYGREILGGVMFSVPMPNATIGLLKMCSDCRHASVCKYAPILKEISDQDVLPVDFEGSCYRFAPIACKCQGGTLSESTDDSRDGKPCLDSMGGTTSAPCEPKHSKAVAHAPVPPKGKDDNTAVGANVAKEGIAKVVDKFSKSKGFDGVFSIPVNDSILSTVDYLISFLQDNNLTAEAIVMNRECIARLGKEVGKNPLIINKISTEQGVLPIFVAKEVLDGVIAKVAHA